MPLLQKSISQSLCFVFLLMSACVSLVSCHSSIGGLNDNQENEAVELSLDEQVHTLLMEQCGGCHIQDEKRPVNAFMSDTSSMMSLVENDYVIAGKVDLSYLYQRVEKNGMPPSPFEPLSDAEKELLKTWIEKISVEKVQANPSLIDDAEIADRARDDIRTFPEVERINFRYISFQRVYNDANTTQQELAIHRQALAKLLSGLTWEVNTIVPVAIDAEEIIYRINISEIFEDGVAVWPAVEALYPLGNALEDSGDLQRLRNDTESTFPIVDGDWFIFQASQPPLYHTLLSLPATEEGLQAKLGIDVASSILDNVGVSRSGFRDSGVSSQNRSFDRLTTPFGYYYVSYDFAPSSNDDASIIISPLGPAVVYAVDAPERVDDRAFNHDGGEIIFSLPNGMQAYMLSNAIGTRINEAPTEIVQDPSMANRVVLNGASCNTCHATGLIDTTDEVRPGFPLLFDTEEYPDTYLSEVLAIYESPLVFSARLITDSQQFQAALATLGIRPNDRDAIWIVFESYRIRNDL